MHRDYCICHCHRRAGVVDADGAVLAMLSPRVNFAFNLFAVPLDDPIEAVSACDGCVRYHVASLVRTPARRSE